jgi:CubicO group peptidase (beta-lactamase class C family)
MSGGGLAQARLERMREAMTRHVESGRMPGLVALISRRGETYVDVIGAKAFDSSEPMQRDTIFRIASLTKPIVAVAAMNLVEECVLRLDDPVDRFLPELGDRKVLRSIAGPLDDTVPARRPITLRDLLTFRLGYGAIFTPSPLQQALTEAGVAAGPLVPAMTHDEYLRRLGALPLAHQPGERWLYNNGSDVLGVLIARAAGMSLGDFLQQCIFTPLGMKDTGFSVPPEKLARLPSSYWTNFETGEFEVFDGVENSRFAQPAVFESGAGGLVSTADDLLAFGEMMLNQGRYGNERILSRPSVALMTTDQITPAQKAASASEFFPEFWESNGWGFGVAIKTRRDDLASPGRYGWEGGYGTSWWVDPAEELIGVLMTQRLWDASGPPRAVLDFWTAAYQAIAD